MLRPRRPHVALLLWLALALLPLRGWALAVMAPQQAAAQAQPSCHEQALEATDATADATTDHAGVCHLCTLCHSAMATPQALALPAGPLPAPTPAARAAPAAPAAPPGRIDKPPRP